MRREVKDPTKPEGVGPFGGYGELVSRYVKRSYVRADRGFDLKESFLAFGIE